MKKLKLVFAALCCLFSVNAYATSKISFEKEVINSRNGNITKYSLKNGIPVYYIENSESAVDEVSIVVKGGRAYLKPEQSGIEKALFTMMSNSSSHYGYLKRLKLGYEKSVSVKVDVSDNATRLSLSCLNYYLDEMLPLLTDSFLNPVFSKAVYDNMITDFSNQLQQSLNDPFSLLKYKVKEVSYKGTAYEAQYNPTEESLKNLTISELKKWHKSVLDSRRICIVAVSSMDAEELLKKLDSTIGTIKALNTELPDVQLENIQVSGENIVIPHTAATGSGYAGRVFQAPLRNSDDYISAEIAAEIFSTTMFNIVRTKHGSCYGAGSVSNLENGIGYEVAYMISDFAGFSKAMKEAREIMAAGKYVEKLNEDGTCEYSSVSTILEGTKNSIINSIYESTTKTDGRVALYVSALVDYNDITAFDSMIDKIHSVSADDVIRVFNKYWVSQPATWFAVVGPDVENKIVFEE